MRHSVLFLLLTFWIVGCSSDEEDQPTPGGDGKLSISDFVPATAAYDSIVTIAGSGFSESPSANTVTLNGIAVSVISAKASELKIKVPKNKNCSGPLMVTVAGKNVTATNSFVYQATYTVTTIAGNTTGSRKSLDGTGIEAKFFGPSGLALDETGVLYIADELGHRIRRIGTDGVVTTLAGSSEAGKADGPAAEATFSSPYGITVSDQSIIYLTDRGRHTIRKIQGGMVSTVAGDGFGFSDGSGSAAKFNSPFGIAINTSGKIFVADYRNYRVRTITNIDLVSTLAGSSQNGITDGQGDNARFQGTTAIAVDKSGNAYVADSKDDFNAIRRITQAGVVKTIAGGPTFGYADGTGAAAKFLELSGIAVDGDGNMFVTDKHRIRMITPEGVVTTLAGGNTAGAVDGVGTNARFNNPTGIVVSSSGTLYVADRDSDLIRKLIGE